jgi:hypothetical protein
MSYFKSEIGAFQPHEIAILEEAFAAVWEAVEERLPAQIDKDELRTAVSEKLCRIAARHGFDDVAALRSETLQDLAF